MRRLAVFSLLGAVVAALVFLGSFDKGTDIVGAQVTTIDQVSIDMGPPGANVGVEGNGVAAYGLFPSPIDPETGAQCTTAGDQDGDTIADDGCVLTLTPREACAEIYVNPAGTVLDADEDLSPSTLVPVIAAAPGEDKLILDITTGDAAGGGIPASRPVTQTNLRLNWNPDVLDILPNVGGGDPVGLSIESALLMGSQDTYSASTPVSVITQSGNVLITRGDSGTGLETGPGVLLRIAVQGAGAGLGALTLTEVDIRDNANVKIDVDSGGINNAYIAVTHDTSTNGAIEPGEEFHCPVPAELEKVSLEVDPPAPGPVAAMPGPVIVPTACGNLQVYSGNPSYHYMETVGAVTPPPAGANDFCAIYNTANPLSTANLQVTGACPGPSGIAMAGVYLDGAGSGKGGLYAQCPFEWDTMPVVATFQSNDPLLTRIGGFWTEDGAPVGSLWEPFPLDGLRKAKISESTIINIHETLINNGEPGGANQTVLADVSLLLEPKEDGVNVADACFDGVDQLGDSAADVLGAGILPPDPDCLIKVSFHVTQADLDLPGDLVVKADTTGDGALDTTETNPVASTTVVGYKILVEKQVNLSYTGVPATDEVVLDQEIDVHCLVPSQHAIRVVNSVYANDSIIAELDSVANNEIVSQIDLACMGVTDLKLQSQSFSGLPATEAPFTSHFADLTLSVTGGTFGDNPNGGTLAATLAQNWITGPGTLTTEVDDSFTLEGGASGAIFYAAREEGAGNGAGSCFNASDDDLDGATDSDDGDCTDPWGAQIVGGDIDEDVLGTAPAGGANGTNDCDVQTGAPTDFVCTRQNAPGSAGGSVHGNFLFNYSMSLDWKFAFLTGLPCALVEGTWDLTYVSGDFAGETISGTVDPGTVGAPDSLVCETGLDFDGMVIVDDIEEVTVTKVLHNNGPSGMGDYMDTSGAGVPTLVVHGGQFVPNALLPTDNLDWGQLANDCTIVDTDGDDISPGLGLSVIDTPASTDTPINETFDIQCNRMGMGVDNDGDQIVDEDSHGDAEGDDEPGVAGIDDDDTGGDLDDTTGEDCEDPEVQAADYDGDTVVLDANGSLTGSCQGGAAAPGYSGDEDLDDMLLAADDDDEDGARDEEPQFHFATFCVANHIYPADQHIEDLNPFNNYVDPTTDPDNGCFTVVVVRPFDPAFEEKSMNDTAADPSIPATDPPDDCLVTLPCKQTVEYSVPSTQDPGGEQPLAGAVTIVPDAYWITRGFGDPINGTVPNGTTVANIEANVNLVLQANDNCAATFPPSFPLVDAALPVAAGEGPDVAGRDALSDATVWPTNLESDPVIGGLIAKFGKSSIWAHYTGNTVALGTFVEINVVVFNVGPLGWFHASTLGDPLGPIEPPGQCTPQWVRATYAGETGLEATYDSTNIEDPGGSQGPCNDNVNNDPAQDKVKDGADPDCYDFTGSAVGRDLRVCKADSIKTAAAFAGDLPGHTFTGLFTRSDIGTATTLFDDQTCSAESDIVVEKDDDLNPDVAIDLPVIVDGLTVNGSIDVIITNGAVPGNVDVSVSLFGPEVCDPQLVPDTDGLEYELISDSDTNKTPDTLTGPIDLGVNQSTRLDWTMSNMGDGEVRHVFRDYQVNCPAGDHPMQIVVSADSGDDFPDPDASNNQDENHPVVHANIADVDQDQVPNGADNCPYDPNGPNEAAIPGVGNQTDSDGDGEGDACDLDDDNDGIPDTGDACPLDPEDGDGVDDQDGCPDTDSGYKNLIKGVYDPDNIEDPGQNEGPCNDLLDNGGDGFADQNDADCYDHEFDVDVSIDSNNNVTVTVVNSGGGVTADLELTLSLRSDRSNPADECVARWIPDAGHPDTYIEEPIGTNLFSILSHVEPAVMPTEGRTSTHTFELHCNAKSDHNANVLFELGVAPLYPVQEEGQAVSDNVHKQWLSIEAWERADIKKVGMVIPDPVLVVSENTPITVRSVVHNNGPDGPVGVTDTVTATAPPDCVFNDPSGAPIQPPVQSAINDTLGVVSVDYLIDHTFYVHCAEPSYHDLVFENELEIGTWVTHVRDTNPDNNTSSAVFTFQAIAQTDPKVTSVSISGPGSVTRSTDFNMTVTALLDNPGAYDPVNTDVTLDLSVPPDCTKNPNSSQSQNSVSVGDGVVVSKTWVVNCSSVSWHTYDASASLVLNDNIHIVDTNLTNNSGQAPTVGNSIVDEADVKITSFSAPADELPAIAGNQILVTAGEDFPDAVGDPESGLECGNDVDDDADTTVDDGCTDLPAVQKATSLTETLHNNGPYGPVTVDIDISIPDVGACDITPNNPSPAPVVLPVSSSVDRTDNLNVDWTNLTKPPYSCTVTATKTLDITTNHISDPVQQEQMDAKATLSFDIVRDADGDTVPDNYQGVIDNCQGVPNPDQTDSDDDDVGDACDPEPFHDDLTKYCLTFGPAPVNLSDTVGAYMWVICEIGNNSDNGDTLPGHDDVVDLYYSVTGLPDACDDDQQYGTPDEYGTQVVLVIPGSETFVLLDDEQKFVLLRVRFQCHDPATPGIFPITITVGVDHQEKIIDLGGPHEHGTGDETPAQEVNNEVTVTKNVIISAVTP